MTDWVKYSDRTPTVDDLYGVQDDADTIYHLLVMDGAGFIMVLANEDIDCLLFDLKQDAERFNGNMHWAKIGPLPTVITT